MKTTLDDLGRIAIPQPAQDDLGADEGILAVEEGVLVFTGELEEDPDLVLQRDREERVRKVAGLD